MKLGDGLFLNTFRRVAEEYKSSGIEFNDMIVDNTYVACECAKITSALTHLILKFHAVGRAPNAVRRDGHA